MRFARNSSRAWLVSVAATSLAVAIGVAALAATRAVPSRAALAATPTTVPSTALAATPGTAPSTALPATPGTVPSRAPSGAPAVMSRATYIGAFAGTAGKPPAGQWNLANREIGPLQSDKIFYGTGTGAPKPLPPSFTGSVCARLKTHPVCVIAYKTASKSTVQSFVESMPAHRSSPVIMVYWDEPELGNSGMSPATYKENFDLRSQWVRQAVRQAKATGKDLSYVKVAMDSSTYGYGKGRPGYRCSYLPAASDVDYYLADVYEHRLTGLQHKADFQRWNRCVAEKGQGKPQGLAEYGLGVCTKAGTSATEPEREQTLSKDAAYLAKDFPHLFLWEYWWSTISGSPSDPCAHSKFPAGSVTAKEWQKIEAGTARS